MAENTDTLPNTPTPGTIEQIALHIKSLEQRTTSVTLPRNASVLELKQEIQVAFDVASNRQRLIFQGRVLKDDKNLTDYANLDNGKVIHLVIRPIDAPHNPQNDDPNPGANIRHPFGRGGAGTAPHSRSRPFPSISSRFPMMEGYAFITLDSNLGDIGDNQSLLSSVLNGLSTGGFGTGLNRSRSGSNGADTHTTGLGRTNSTSSTTSTGPPSFSQHRSPFSFHLNRSHSSEFGSPPLTSTPLAERVSSSLPFPPSIEVRLARTLGSMRNVRTMLEDAADSSHVSSTTPHSTPEQLQEIRNRLRTSGNNQSAQIGMVLNEFADIMAEAAPRMREVSQSLRQENQTSEEERNTSRRVLNMSRIVQGMSMINHFLGSVLASADIDPRRTASSHNASSVSTTSTNSTTSSITPPSSTTALLRPPSFFSIRGNTEAVRTPAPRVDTRIVTPSNNNTTARPLPSRVALVKTRSNPKTTTVATASSASGSSSGSLSRGTKRRINQVNDEEDNKSNRGVKRGMMDVDDEEETGSRKSSKNEKGKEKDKKN